MNRSTRNIRESLPLSTRRRAGAAPAACASCSRPTAEPRGGLCSACYQRTRRGHHVAESACRVCGAADRRTLRRHKLAEGIVTLCANDAAVAGRRTLTLEQLRAEVLPQGDRRGPSRRRQDRRGSEGVRERRTRLDVSRMLDDDRRGPGLRRASDPRDAAEPAAP